MGILECDLDPDVSKWFNRRFPKKPFEGNGPPEPRAPTRRKKGRATAGAGNYSRLANARLSDLIRTGKTASQIAENETQGTGLASRVLFVDNGGQNCMARTIAYWASTGLLAALSLFAAYAYLSGSPQAVQGFAHVGYPQQLRIILGIAKLSGAITLVVPGVPKLKEWAYAGFTFAWISAFFAHYLAKDGPTAFSPLVLLALLAVSYTTRPASRQWLAKVVGA
jgi:hypothetical protein